MASVLHVRRRPNFKLIVDVDDTNDPGAKKRVHSSVYTYVRKTWKDMDALRAKVAKYMARHGRGMDASITWGPHILYAGETLAWLLCLCGGRRTSVVFI